MRGGDKEAAIHYFRQAIEIDDDFAKAQGAIGTLYLQMGGLEAAEKHLQQAIALDDRMEQAHLNLAYLYRQTHRTPRAVEIYQRLLQMSPDQKISSSTRIGTHVGLGTIYHQA